MSRELPRRAFEVPRLVAVEEADWAERPITPQALSSRLSFDDYTKYTRNGLIIHSNNGYHEKVLLQTARNRFADIDLRGSVEHQNYGGEILEEDFARQNVYMPDENRRTTLFGYDHSYAPGAFNLLETEGWSDVAAVLHGLEHVLRSEPGRRI